MFEIDLEWEGLDEAFAEAERELTDAARGVTLVAWNRILDQTPQFYGRLAASWTYSIGQPTFVDRSAAVDTTSARPRDFAEDAEEGDVFAGRRKGDPEAIGIANFASAGREAGFRLGDTVWIANGADHGEGPYAEDIEAGHHLRPVNQPGHMVARALDYVQAHYGLDVTPAQAKRLPQRLGE